MSDSEPPPISTDPNGYIRDFIHDYFADKRRADHAVMLHGAWGIGKSTFVRELLKELETQHGQKRLVYVSLAGLSSVAEFDDAVAAAMFPFIKSDLTAGTMKLAGVLARRFGVDADIKLTDAVQKLNAALYVFDDLERCRATVDVSLGYINQFVEHDSCKVLIIADEDEIDPVEKERYNVIKEKIVGQTFTFNPVIEGPIDEFIGLVECSAARKALINSRQVIIGYFSNLPKKNLRILKHSILDYGRLISKLDDSVQKLDAVTHSSLHTFLPLSLMLRAAQIDAAKVEQLLNKSYGLMFAKPDSEEKKLYSEFDRRFPENTADDRLLLAEQWVDVIVHSRVDADALNKQIFQSRIVAGDEGQPSWTRLWSAFDQTDEVVDFCIKDVEEKFSNFEYTVPGEFFHVVGLRLWLADDGLIESSVEDVVEHSISYVDQLYDTGAILTQNPNSDIFEERYDRYGGLGVQRKDTEEYKRIYKYYREQRKKAEEESLPDQASKLLDDLSSNPREFIRQIAFTNDGGWRYREIPILAHADVEVFVNKVFGLGPADIQSVFSAIKSRYESEELKGLLSSERPWLVELSKSLEERAASKAGFAAVRIQKQKAWTVDAVLESWSP